MNDLKSIIYSSERNSVFESVVNAYNAIFEEMRIPQSIESWLSDSVVKIPVYHGTGKSFDKFDESKTNPENYFGRGIYFTDSPEDVSKNYGHGKTGDFTSRIENTLDRIMGGDENALHKAVVSYLEQTRPKWSSKAISNNADVLVEKFTQLMLDDEDRAKKLIKEMVSKSHGNKYRTIPAFIRLTNPVIITEKNGTVFDYSFDGDLVEPEYDPENEEELDKAVAAGYDRDDYDGYYREKLDEYNDNRYNNEPTGTLATFISLLSDYGDGLGDYYSKRIGELVGEIQENFMDGVSVFKLMQFLRNSNNFMVEDSEGNMNNMDVVNQIFRKMGYDGIIMDPDPKWNMDIEPGTRHYIVFDPKNIKSAFTGNTLG